MEEDKIKDYLLKVAQTHYPHGDSFFANKIITKKGNRWVFGSSNDYPLQHGNGYKFELAEDLIIAFIKVTREELMKYIQMYELSRFDWRGNEIKGIEIADKWFEQNIK